MQKINYKKIVFLCMVVMIVLTPLALQADPLVPCGFDGNGDGEVKDIPNSPTSSHEECRFNDFVLGIKNIIDYLIIIAGSLAAIAFAYAGFLYMTAAGDETKVGEAHSIFSKVAIGFVIMLSAWLIVHTIEVTLLAPGFYSLGN